jgi:hypothetical protein
MHTMVLFRSWGYKMDKRTAADFEEEKAMAFYGELKKEIEWIEGRWDV